MKTTRNLMLIFSLVLFALPTRVHAQGSSGRGGGDMVHQDGHWELFEIARMKGGGTTFRLSSETRTALLGVQELLFRYSGIAAKRLWSEVFSDIADYRLVDRLPCSLEKDLIYYGCTDDGVTYFQKGLFNKLSAQQQLLAIIHERSHVLDDSPDAHDAWIRPLIQGLDVLISLKGEQDRGDFRNLEPFEKRALLQLLNNNRLISILGGSTLPPQMRSTVTSRGGGVLIQSRRFPAPELDAKSFLSVTSRIDHERCPETEIRVSAVALNDSYLGCADADRLTMKHSVFYFVPTNKNSRVTLEAVTATDSELEWAVDSAKIQLADFIRAKILNDRPLTQILIKGSTLEESELDWTDWMLKRPMTKIPVTPEHKIDISNQNVLHGVSNDVQAGWPIPPEKQTRPQRVISLVDSVF